MTRYEYVVEKLKVESCECVPGECGCECLIYPFAPNNSGYGSLKLHQQDMMAHRFALEWRLGRPLTKGYQTSHKCHTKLCFRPAHVIEELPKDNNARKREVGTYYTGEQLSWSKLKETDIPDIFKAYAGGEESQKSIGKRYGISQSVVASLLKRETWAHVLIDQSLVDRCARNVKCKTDKIRSRKVFDAETVLDIRLRHSYGVRIIDLARMYGVTRRSIRLIISRETWKHI